MVVTRDFIHDPNLVLYLPLYKLDGAEITSQDAYGHLATVTGALWRLDGRLFDGDDKIVIPNHAALNFGDGDFSLGIWFRVASTVGAQILIEKGSTGAGGKEYSFFMTFNGLLQLRLDDDTNVTAANGAADFDSMIDEWHFSGVSVERAANIQHYLDGVADGAGTANTTLLTIDDTAERFAIGVNSGVDTNFLENGAVAGEVFAFNRALSALEWRNIWFMTKGRY